MNEYYEKANISKLHLYFIYDPIECTFIIDTTQFKIVKNNGEKDVIYGTLLTKIFSNDDSYLPFDVKLSYVDIIKSIMERTEVYDKFIAYNECEMIDNDFSKLHGTGCVNVIGDYIGMFEHEGQKDLVVV